MAGLVVEEVQERTTSGLVRSRLGRDRFAPRNHRAIEVVAITLWVIPPTVQRYRLGDTTNRLGPSSKAAHPYLVGPEQVVQRGVDGAEECTSIDARHMEKPYYIAPRDAVGQEAFAVIRDGLERKQLVGTSRGRFSRQRRTSSS